MVFQRSHPAFTRTTAYACSYTYKPTISGRTTRFRHLPSMEVKQSPNFIVQDLHVPKGPHRRLTTAGLYSEAVASNAMNLSLDKPIVRSPRPQDFNRELLHRTEKISQEQTFAAQNKNKRAKEFYCDKKVNRISVQRRWTSTTREATEESALPTPRYSVPQSTLETCADPVKPRAQKYHPHPCFWQQYAREWDSVQFRKPMPALGEQKTSVSLPAIPENCSVVMQNSTQPALQKAAIEKSQECESFKTNNLSAIVDCQEDLVFTRPMPGYGGFVPRNAVEPRPITDEECLTASICSTSRRTYRSFPSEEYRELHFAHKGPLSKTVTLTYPFNAFNKVE